MAATKELIKRIRLTTSAASITFYNIPQDFDGLELVVSARTSNTGVGGYAMLDFNGDTSNTTQRHLHGNGSSAASYTYTNQAFFYVNGASTTANTFSNARIFIPKYALTGAKSASIDAVIENNDINSSQNLTAHLWTGTAALTSIRLVAADSSLVRTGNFVQYSSAALYGWKKGSDGITSVG